MSPSLRPLVTMRSIWWRIATELGALLWPTVRLSQAGHFTTDSKWAMRDSRVVDDG